MKKTLGSSLAIAAVLFALGGCAGNAKQESVGEFVDDAVITAKVKSAFVEDKEVSALNVRVETYKGMVQLSGFVSSREAMNQAVRVTSGIKGVSSVKNDMRIR